MMIKMVFQLSNEMFESTTYTCPLLPDMSIVFIFMMHAPTLPKSRSYRQLNRFTRGQEINVLIKD